MSTLGALSWHVSRSKVPCWRDHSLGGKVGRGSGEGLAQLRATQVNEEDVWDTTAPAEALLGETKHPGEPIQATELQNTINHCFRSINSGELCHAATDSRNPCCIRISTAVAKIFILSKPLDGSGAS